MDYGFTARDGGIKTNLHSDVQVTGVVCTVFSLRLMQGMELEENINKVYNSE